MSTLYTIGHGSRSLDELVAVLAGAGVRRVVDVRSRPMSRRNPQFDRPVLEAALAKAGIAYLWRGHELGGLRRGRKDSPHRGLADAAERAFADHMRSEAFLRAAEELAVAGAEAATAILCAEADPYRCHRRFIADWLVVRGVEVVHLLGDGAACAHALHPLASASGDGLAYDGADGTQAPASMSKWGRSIGHLFDRRGIAFTAILAAVLSGLLAWKLSPAGRAFDPAAFASGLVALAEHPGALPIGFAIFVFATLAGLPATVALVVTAMVFGSWAGFFVAYCGALVSAVAGYGIGHGLGRRFVRRLAGRRGIRLSRRMGRRGLMAIVALRFLPVVPFTVVNLVAGTSHIRLRDFVLGNLLGLLPGTLAIVGFVGQARGAFRNPGVAGFALLAGVGLVLALALYGLRRWARRHA